MDWKSRINTLLEAGQTIDGIATEMGVTGNAIREILSGRTKAPRADAAMRLLAMRPELFGLAPKKDAA